MSVHGAIGLVGPSQFWVRWACRRCGHQHGVARTTAPMVGPETPEFQIRNLLDSLRVKLVKVHMKQGCIASVEDFVLERVRESDREIVGLV